MRPIAWPCPAPGGSGEEFALISGPDDAAAQVLIVPALFEEANRTRRLLAETMRGLADRGIATVLIDLPGCGESLAPLERQDLTSWRAAVAAAALHFAASHVFSIRGGALIVRSSLPGWQLEPSGSPLRSLLRARMIVAREQGRDETMAGLTEAGLRDGLELAGYRLGPRMIAALASAKPNDSAQQPLTLAELGGTPLWLRSEPGEDPALAAALVMRIAADLGR